jgi:predicted AAA+ superfamily ATPase
MTTCSTAAIPGAAPLIGEPARWARYVADSLIETSISRDVLLLTRVDKPALLRRLFELACRYSGQVLSYTKMLGQLQDAGQHHHARALSRAAGGRGHGLRPAQVRGRRGAQPRLQPEAAGAEHGADDGGRGYTLAEARADREFWGRLVESAVGAHLANAAMRGECALHYWRERNHEVDFVVQAGRG